jgi:hypothetical protein
VSGVFTYFSILFSHIRSIYEILISLHIFRELSTEFFFISAYSSNPKMEAMCSSETSVDFQRTTRHDIPEDSTLHNHRCENLKSYTVSLWSVAGMCAASGYLWVTGWLTTAHAHQSTWGPCLCQQADIAQLMRRENDFGGRNEPCI